jgi:hypothetical protein
MSNSELFIYCGTALLGGGFILAVACLENKIKARHRPRPPVKPFPVKKLSPSAGKIAGLSKMNPLSGLPRGTTRAWATEAGQVFYAASFGQFPTRCARGGRNF